MNRTRSLALICLLLCAAAWCAPRGAWAQAADASLPNSPAPAVQSSHPGDGKSFVGDVTWKETPWNFLRDQKAIWLSPGQLAKGRGWIPTLLVAGGTAGLIASDPHTMPYFRDHARNLDDVNDVFDELTTTAEVVALPLSLMTAGYARHDSYMTSTALLAGEAYADAAVVDLVVKAVSRRERPSEVPVGASFDDTFFNGKESQLKGSSFPSGHAATAFAVATVVATRYKNHRWVPWAAYGFATAVSLSRITTSAHFPSDAFVGAALGYSVSRFQVLRPR